MIADTENTIIRLATARRELAAKMESTPTTDRQYMADDDEYSITVSLIEEKQKQLKTHVEGIINDLGESTELKRDEFIIIRGILERYLGRMEDY